VTDNLQQNPSQDGETGQVHVLRRQFNQLQAAHEQALHRVGSYEQEIENLKEQLHDANTRLQYVHDDQLLERWVDRKMAQFNGRVSRLFSSVNSLLRLYRRSMMLTLLGLMAVGWLTGWDSMFNMSYALTMFGAFIYVLQLAAHSFREHYRDAMNKLSSS